MLKENLRNQLAEKNAKTKLTKDINSDFIEQFKAKVRSDEAREELNQADLNRRKKECQQFILQQIEEKRARQKGMTKDEFEMNRALLSEISSKKQSLKDTLMLRTMEGLGGASAKKAKPEYLIYNLWVINSVV